MRDMNQTDLHTSKDWNQRERVPCPLCGEVVQNTIQLRASIGGFPMSIGEHPKCHIALQTPRPTIQESRDYINWRFASTDPRDIYN